MRTLSAVALCSFLVAIHPHAQYGVRPSDPAIKAEVVTATQGQKPGAPIIVDVYVQNLTKEDIRRNRFSPVSSSVGTPSFQIVKVPQGDEIQLSVGLFPSVAGEWEKWYQPASGREATPGGRFVLPAGARTHLLHGDLRGMVQGAGEYCQEELARGNLLEKPDAALTKKYYQDVVRFAQLFAAGGEFDLTVWAYAKSNTVRIQVAPSRGEASESVLYVFRDALIAAFATK